MRFCALPFENIEIDNKGFVYTCCPTWINWNSIGNIFENSLAEIWNSEKAKELRESVLNGSYNLCSKEYCNDVRGDFKPPHLSFEDMKIQMERLPYAVKLSYDKECNIDCKICRDNIILNSDEEYKQWDEVFFEKILPYLKETKIVTVNSHGDSFGSRHSRKVIKAIASTYPNIRFDFHTNATLCDEKMLKTLNVFDKFDVMRISVSATTAETYKKIVGHATDIIFEKLMSNLKMLSDIKRQRDFDYKLHFIVNSQNYTEIADFARMAESLGAMPCFWEYNLSCSAYAHNLDESWRITNPKHPKYKELQEILQDSIFDNHILTMSPVLLKIRNGMK